MHPPSLRTLLLLALLNATAVGLGACTTVVEAPAQKTLSAEEISTAMFTRAEAFYLSEDYVNAAKLMRPLAEQGHLQAQYTLGYMYYFGQGLPRNEREAIRWLAVAAARGDAKAKAALAIVEQGESAPGGLIK